MAKTIQKKVKFSKGQIVPELAERVDLNILNESAKKMENVVSTIYGGVRRRLGTRFLSTIDNVLYRKNVSFTSSHSFIKDYDIEESFPSKRCFITEKTDILVIDYGKNEAGFCQIEFVGLIPTVGPATINVWGSEDNKYFLKEKSFVVTRPPGQIIDTSKIKHYAKLSKRYRYIKVSVEGTGTTDDQIFFSTIKMMISDVSSISKKIRLLDFVYNDSDKNLLVIKNGQIDFYKDYKYVESIEAPGITDDFIPLLKWSSKDDTIVFTHPNMHPKILKRTYSGSSFEIDYKCYKDAVFYYYVKTNAVVGDFIYYADGGAFNTANSEKDLVLSVLKIVRITDSELVYSGNARVFTRDSSLDIKKETILNDGWLFSDLDIKNIPYGVFGEEKKVQNTGKKIKPTGTEGAIKLKSVSDDEGTQDGADIFTPDMVGQYIDGNGGRAKITEFVSKKEIGVNTVIPFYTDKTFSEWSYIHGYEPVWSEERGYPRTCLFANQRLWFGGSLQKPNTIWGSRLGDYFDFKNSGNYDNDSIDVTLLTNDVIVNIMENRGLHIFTTGQEITASESSLTPSGFTATINTKNGSLAEVNPIVLGDGTCVFVDKNGKSLLSYIYDYNQSSYTTGDLTLLSNLLKQPTRINLDRNSSRDKGDFLFIVLSDGTMLVNCFVLKENINSLSVFKTEGKILDVCCVGSDTFLLVIRGNKICLEFISPNNSCLGDCESIIEIKYEQTYVPSAYYETDIVVYDGKKTYGKYHINSLGQLNVPSSLVGKTYKIGYPYSSELISNNISINNATTSVKKRITSAEVVCKSDKTKELVFNGQRKSKKDGIYTFYSCTPYGKEVNFNIRSEFEPFEVYSITLNINYEG